MVISVEEVTKSVCHTSNKYNYQRFKCFKMTSTIKLNERNLKKFIYCCL